MIERFMKQFRKKFESREIIKPLILDSEKKARCCNAFEESREGHYYFPFWCKRLMKNLIQLIISNLRM